LFTGIESRTRKIKHANAISILNRKVVI